MSWVRQNYFRAETLTQANAQFAAAQNGIDLARRWGGGDVASADGLRFVVPVRTIHAGPNPKYFGSERAVTYYNLVSDQFTGLNAITVPGTLRDSLVLLSVVLEQETELEPTEIMTDTGAYTDVIFGIFWSFFRDTATSPIPGLDLPFRPVPVANHTVPTVSQLQILHPGQKCLGLLLNSLRQQPACPGAQDLGQRIIKHIRLTKTNNNAIFLHGVSLSFAEVLAGWLPASIRRLLQTVITQFPA
jgi:hypothetical protein